MVQGKWVQHATPHLFSLSWITFFDGIFAPLRDGRFLLYFAGETLNSQSIWVCFCLSCFGSPGCVWWILQVSHLIEPKSQSKTQQSSSIICLTHKWKHQSVMVPLKQIRASSKFDRNFTFVTAKPNQPKQTEKNPNKPTNPCQSSSHNMDSIPGLSFNSCCSVSWWYEWQLFPLTKGWWRLCFTRHKDTKNIIQPGHKGRQCSLRVRRTATCLCLCLWLWSSSTIIILINIHTTN